MPDDAGRPLQVPDANELAWGQRAHSLRFDWGQAGAAAVAEPHGILVVVDVLSFTTTLGIAVERGIIVYPAASGDARSHELARREDAVHAVSRGQVSDSTPWSLSGAHLRAAPYTPRLVLPSPNGSTIASSANGALVVAASLRNAALVAEWLHAAIRERPRPISVVAAGERWPDGSLRLALEDGLGAGAVISFLLSTLPDLDASPEAASAGTLWNATASPANAVRKCASGLELAAAGYADDVEVACEIGQGTAVPVMSGPAFHDALAP